MPLHPDQNQPPGEKNYRRGAILLATCFFVLLLVSSGLAAHVLIRAGWGAFQELKPIEQQ